MPRLFCALKIPANVSMELSLLYGGLSGARWIDAENHHITLQFFGDIDRRNANDLALALSAIRRDTFELQIDRLDAFGGSKPHTIFAHIRANPALSELQHEIESIARRLSLIPDRRKFTPHVTLARLRGTSPLEAARYLSLKGGYHCRPFEVNGFELMSSRDSIGGGPYVCEQRYRLGGFNPAAIAAEYSGMPR
jgi:2'-5' RNA ligase